MSGVPWVTAAGEAGKNHLRAKSAESANPQPRATGLEASAVSAVLRRITRGRAHAAGDKSAGARPRPGGKLKFRTPHKADMSLRPPPTLVRRIPRVN